LSTLENEQLLGKLVILQGYNDAQNELQALSLSYLKVDGLFMTHKLASLARKPTPLNMTPFNAVTTNGGLISPQSSPRPPGRLIDLSLVCNIFHCPLFSTEGNFWFTALAQAYARHRFSLVTVKLIADRIAPSMQ
jgi:hypothetical protein